MKKLGDVLLQPEPFSELLMGNHALVRAMLESGVRVATSYPGSPTPEIGAAITSLPREKNPIYFEFSVNEKVALEVAFGAAVNGHTSCVFFKSVGLNVASDSFVQLGLMDIPGGMVIVLGDDPGANSSQNEQDNRHFGRLSYIPIFEPKDPAEAYKMFKEAVRVSREKHMPVVLRLTTHVCHAKQKIEFAGLEIKEPDNEPKFSPEKFGPYIPLTRSVFELKKIALERLKKFQEDMKDSPFNEIINNGADRGIITAGLPFKSLLEVVPEIEEGVNILRLGVVHPLPENLIIKFLKEHGEVKILEELDDFIEQKIKALAYDNNLNTIIEGKVDLDDWIGEYTPDKVRDVLEKNWPDLLPPKESKKPIHQAIPRPPQMCPGCGHRSGFYAIKKALAEGEISVADIGCHTLGYLPPYSLGQVLLSMGHSSGTASGLSLFNTSKKVVAFLGDSTLFHAGLPGIINSVFNQHNFTLIIMENDTTAMTGHQDNPGSGRNVRGETKKIAIAPLLESLGVEKILEVDTYNQQKLTDYVKEALDFDGFSVVIAKHPCMLKFSREQRKKGRILKKVQITDKCREIHACVSTFGCPSFQLNQDGTVWVHEDLCIGDGSCVQTCPVQAIEIKK